MIEMRTAALDFSQALGPFNELSVVRDFIEPLRASAAGRAAFHPSCDIAETQTHYLLSFDLPGVSKDDVKIELEDGELRVWGERKAPKEWPSAEQKQEGDKDTRLHFVERAYGKFQRVFSLPTAVEADQVKARFADGVLFVSLPKAAAARPKLIAIEG
jgi:HSP20 family protein